MIARRRFLPVRRRNRWLRSRRLRLSAPARTSEPAAPGVPYAARGVYRGLLLGALAVGAVYLSLVSVNVLLLGTDDVDYSQHTDTVLLVHWRPLPRRLALLSIPRDTLVTLPKRGPLKLNEVYAYGKALNGPDFALAMTRSTLENLLGLKVHYVLHLRYSDVIQWVDAVGGVPVYVPKRLQYEDHAGGVNIDLPAGYQLLDGRRALDFLRFRHDEEGDLGRIRRQQEFLRAFAAQSAAPPRWPRLVRAASGFLNRKGSDLGPATAAFLALEMRGLIGRNWRKAILPGRTAYLDGKAYWRTDPTEVRACVRELGRSPRALTPVPTASVSSAASTPAVSGPAQAAAGPRPDRAATALTPAAPAVPTQVPARRDRSAALPPRPAGPQPIVRVLNGCGVNGICKPVAQNLRAQGLLLHDRDITNAPNFDFAITVIKTRARNLPWAERVAKMLGLPPGRIQLVPETVAYPTVTVIVGKDHREWME